MELGVDCPREGLPIVGDDADPGKRGGGGDVVVRDNAAAGGPEIEMRKLPFEILVILPREHHRSRPGGVMFWELPRAT